MRKVKKAINRQRQATMRNWSKCLVHHVQSQLRWILSNQKEAKLTKYEVNGIDAANAILEEVRKVWR